MVMSFPPGGRRDRLQIHCFRGIGGFNIHGIAA